MRYALLLALLLTPGVVVPGRAGAAEMGELLRARNWAAAEALAAGAADPIAARLVTFERLLTPAAARADEIDAFITQSPDWPLQGLLRRRYAEALAGESDGRLVRALCQRRAPGTAPALLRCADAAARVGVGGSGAAEARQAWLEGVRDPAGEAAFMRRWGAFVTADDQWQRFEQMAWSESAAPAGPLARQAVRLGPAVRNEAEARLALRRDDPTGPALFAALPVSAQADPGLVLDLARWYRRAHREEEAAALWLAKGTAAEAAAPEGRQADFWRERNALARQLLRLHQGELALSLVSLPTPAVSARPDATFLAGWIALRVLSQPAQAEASFAALAAGGSAITQGRGHYWLGRALAAAGQPAEAAAAYRAAAAWPTTYYGQLASLALGEGLAGLRQRIAAAADPGWDEAKALALAGSPFGRAATLLAAWGEKRLAKPFLLALDGQATDPAGRTVVARLALGLGLPDGAVATARLAGRDGVMLPGSGWPEAADPPAGKVERAVALGLIRQESSFDAGAGSPVGAQGLMQLMPGTAADMARRLGGPAGPLTDPAINLRLGTAYLGTLLDRFGALPPALAGYNAGPGRVREWIAAYGDPATGGIDPIDWIELIPFTETRDYVQRVVENIVIYRARAGTELAHPVLQWASDGT